MPIDNLCESIKRQNYTKFKKTALANVAAATAATEAEKCIGGHSMTRAQ
jgi:hypothetical protein